MYNTKIVAQMIKDLPAMWKTWVQFLHWEGPLEEGMATHFQYSYLETLHGEEEPGWLQSTGLWRVAHNWATKHSTARDYVKIAKTTFIFMQFQFWYTDIRPEDQITESRVSFHTDFYHQSTVFAVLLEFKVFMTM